MKFSDETLAIFKNFSSINPSIALLPGNTIRTIHPERTAIAQATIDEIIPSEAYIYDLTKFLATLALFDNHDVQFKKDRFSISSDKNNVTYFYATREVIIMAPDKQITLQDPKTSFSLQWKDIDKIIRAAGILRGEHIHFIADEDGIFIRTSTGETPSADSFKIQVSDLGSNKFDLKFKVENFRMIPNDYEVTISQKGLMWFKSPKVEYWLVAAA